MFFFFSNTVKKSSRATMRIERPTWLSNMAINGTSRKAIPVEKWVKNESRRHQTGKMEMVNTDNFLNFCCKK